MKKIFKTLVVFASVAIFLPAHAGDYNGREVVISTSARSASGTVGEVRYSSDSTQRIGCHLHTYTPNGNFNNLTETGGCSAVDSSGTLLTGSTSREEFLKVIGTVTNASYIKFFTNSSNEITNIIVFNKSDSLY